MERKKKKGTVNQTENFSRWSAGLRIWDRKVLVLLVTVSRPVLEPLSFLCSRSGTVRASGFHPLRDRPCKMWGSHCDGYGLRRRVAWVMCTEFSVETVVFITSVVSHPAERVSFSLSRTYECIRRPFHALFCRTGQGTDFANLKKPRYVYNAHKFRMRSCNTRNIFLLLKTQN
jgi:hypothetical protein